MTVQELKSNALSSRKTTTGTVQPPAGTQYKPAHQTKKDDNRTKTFASTAPVGYIYMEFLLLLSNYFL